jgi:hypothetical protein
MIEPRPTTTSAALVIWLDLFERRVGFQFRLYGLMKLCTWQRQ